MSAAEKLDLELDESEISDPMTKDEIYEKFPESSVWLVEIDWTNRSSFEFRTARVIVHGKTRKECVDRVIPWWKRYKQIGHLFTGTSAHCSAFDYDGEVVPSSEREL